MQVLSPAYREQSNKSVRNPSHLRVTFGIIDPQAVEASTITDNGAMAYSETNKIDLAQYAVNRPYGRLYENGFVLDGSQYAVPDNTSDYLYQGFVSNKLSDGTGVYQEPPTLYADFDRYVNLAGIMLSFDRKLNNYPKEITIRFFDGEELLGEETIQNDTAYLLYENTMPEAAITNRMEVVLRDTNFPYRDVRVDNLVFGVIKIFTDDDLESATFNRDVDLINGKIPEESFNFTIIDAERDFDADDPTGLWEYLEEDQQVIVEMGYELDDGTTEWTKLCEYYTTGEVSIAPYTIPRVTFETTSILSHLNDNYIKGLYRPGGITLYSLALEVLESLNLPLNVDGSKKWELDEFYMSQFSTKTPLPVLPAKECLQLIASAALCVMYTNRNGDIVIEPRNYDFIQYPQFRYSFDNIFTPPMIKKYPLLRDVVVDVHGVTANSNTIVLTEEEITGATGESYEISYAMSTGQTIQVSGLTIIGTPVFYAETCVVSLRGTGTVTISGKPVLLSTSTYKKRYNSVGDDCPVTLELINNRSHAERYAEYVHNYVKLRTEYQIEDRGYMEVDPFDTVFADTGYGGYQGVVIAKTQLDFNGAVRGRTRYYQTLDYSQYVENIVIVSNGETAYSNVQNVILPDAVIMKQYGRLYENGIVLDGNTTAIPDGSYATQGYVSDIISGSTGALSTKPRITMTFARYVILSAGFTMTFGDENNFPNSITVSAYNGNEFISSIELEPTGYIFSYPDTFPAEQSMSRMDITFNSTKFPYRDIKLNSLFFGAGG